MNYLTNHLRSLFSPSFATVFLVAAYATLTPGCTGNQDDAGQQTVAVEDDHDHAEHDGDDHDDDHDDHDGEHVGHEHPPHGPHGGHLVTLQPAGMEVEWSTNRNEDQVVVYLTEPPEEAEVAMRTEIEGQEPQLFELTQDESLGENAYQVVSPNLMTAIAAGDAADVELLVTTPEGEQSVEVHLFEH